MIPDLNSKDFEQLEKLLQNPKKVVITTHHKPDGDAMGSAMGLYNFLIKNDHQVEVITSSDYPSFLHWMKNNDQVIHFHEGQSKAINLIEEAELIFCLDYNQLSRTEALAEHIDKSNAIKVLIDHHLEPDSFCDINFSFVTSCATCEVLYHILSKLDDTLIDQQIAECLYTGIMTDTGSFRFDATSYDTHIVAARLLEKGVSPATVHERIYDDFSEDRTRFLGHCIQNKLVVLPQFKTAYISVTLEEQEKFNNKTGDTEGIVNYALSIKGVVMAALFIEHKDLIKISFRSKGTFSVRDLSSKHFNGGSYRNSAGGRSHASLDTTIDRFKTILVENSDKLNNN
jgi:phosphoesterase RecJ-like protein